MAGIYIHIPFCKQICHYCDFYKVANLKLKSNYLNALSKEIVLKKSFFNEQIDTIYWGGGTPSVLSIQELAFILELIYANYTIATTIEHTIEVNPDDLDSDYYKGLLQLGFNRLSVGIQSFNDSILKFLNRRHTAETAKRAILTAQDAGFNNLSGDLIYGIPSQTIDHFTDDIEYFNQLTIQHLSAYHLGIEERTYFGKLKRNNKISDINENLSHHFFTTLTNVSADYGYEQYEISNLTKNKHYSKHNKNYWFHVPYLGFGPSAHSFYNNQRFYNYSNLNKYIKAIENKQVFYEKEQLKTVNLFNEYVMLRLRTKWGINLHEIKLLFGDKYKQHLLKIFSKFKDSGYIRIEKGKLLLTMEGYFVSDYLFSEFFID